MNRDASPTVRSAPRSAAVRYVTPGPSIKDPITVAGWIRAQGEADPLDRTEQSEGTQ